MSRHIKRRPLWSGLFTVVGVIACLGFAARPAHAQVGTGFVYQGELRASGAPVAGPVDLNFRLYSAISGGIQVGTQQSFPGVTLNIGRFTETLDFGAGAFAGEARFLEIDVRNPAGSGSYATLSPRQTVTAAPMAQFSLNADAAASATNATQLNGQGPSFYQNASNLTSGTLPGGLLGGMYAGALTFSNAGNSFTGSGDGLTALNASNLATGTLSAARFPVPLTLTGSSTTHIMRGENTNTTTNASGVYGLASAGTGSTYGVQGQNASTSGKGVAGWATAASGNTYGVYGQSDSANGGAGLYGSATASTGANAGVYATTNSNSGKGVYGIASSTGGGSANYGGYFVSSGGLGTGVFGWANSSGGTPYGVSGRSDGNTGRAVFGDATATTGANYGGWFQTASTSGTAVYGIASATTGSTIGGRFETPSASGIGVKGVASSSGPGTTYGVVGESSTISGVGVKGHATTGQGIGVVGLSDDPASGTGVSGSGAIGVQGYSTATSGEGGLFQSANVGVACFAPTGGYFESYGYLGVSAYCSGAEGAGVRGESAGLDGYGVLGVATGSFGLGISGLCQSTNGAGAYGDAASFSGLNYGVYGTTNSPDGYAGYFHERTHINGELSKLSGAFKIDHPLDPTNKYLVHSFVESPDMMNVYNGSVVTDAQGYATVALPAYFETLNKDFRYQLTVVDEGETTDFAQVKVVRKIRGNSFILRSSRPRVEVSWQVTGIRKDPWAEAHRIQPEPDKNEFERGKYLTPDLYGQPKEMGIHYRPAVSQIQQGLRGRGK